MRFDCAQKALETLFYKHGIFIAKYPLPFLIIPIVITLGSSAGFIGISLIGYSPEYLYTPLGAQSKTERSYFQNNFPENHSNGFVATRKADLDGFLQVIVRPGSSGNNLYSQYYFERIDAIDIAIRELNITHNGTILAYDDVCANWYGACTPNIILDIWHQVTQNISALTLTWPVYNGVYYLGSTVSATTVDSQFNTTVTSIPAVMLTYFVKYQDSNDVTISNVWLEDIKNYLLDLEASTTDVIITFQTSVSANEELIKTAYTLFPMFAIAFTILSLFTFLSCFMLDWVRSKPWVALAGELSAGMAVVTTIGILNACGVLFCDATGLMPFLVIGIGIDDMYVILSSWRHTSYLLSVEERLGKTMETAAISITITSITDVLAFCIGAISPFRAVVSYGVYTGAALVVTYTYAITFLPAVLVYSGKREGQNRHSCTCLVIPSQSIAIQHGRSKIFRFFCAGGYTLVNEDEATTSSKNNYETSSNIYITEAKTDVSNNFYNTKNKNYSSYTHKNNCESDKNILVRSCEANTDIDQPEAECKGSGKKRNKSTLANVNIEHQNNSMDINQNPGQQSNLTTRNNTSNTTHNVTPHHQNNTGTINNRVSIVNNKNSIGKVKINNNLKEDKPINQNGSATLINGNLKNPVKINNVKHFSYHYEREIKRQKSSFTIDKNYNAASINTNNNNINYTNNNIKSDNNKESLVIGKSSKNGTLDHCDSIIKDDAIEPDHDRHIDLPILNEFYKEMFSPFVNFTAVKIVVAIAYVIYFAIGLWGCTTLTEGIEEKNLVSASSYLVDFYNDYDDYIGVNFGPRIMIAITETVDYSNSSVSSSINTTLNSFQNSEWFSSNPVMLESWLHQFNIYLSSTNQSTSNITQFISVLRSDFLTQDIYSQFSVDIKFDENYTEISESRFMIQGIAVTNSVERRSLMIAARGVAESSEFDMEIYHPSFIFWDQYNLIVSATIQTLGIAIGCILLVSLILLANVLSIVVVMISVISIMVGVFGYMSLWGVPLNALTIIYLAMCIGFSVDFCAHICYHFAISKEHTGLAVTKDTLSYLGFPISQATISTVLGVVILATSDSFIFLGFFRIVFLVMIIGLIHGIIFLPVLLSTFTDLNFCCVNENKNKVQVDRDSVKDVQVNGQNREGGTVKDEQVQGQNIEGSTKTNRDVATLETVISTPPLEVQFVPNF